MKVIVCVDEKNGMLFNNRRQSRDSKVIERILEIVAEKRLNITEFSKNLFTDLNVNIVDNSLENVAENEYVFVENIDINSVLDKVNEIVIFNWNRHYPADFYLDIPLENFNVVAEREFSGSSHDKITEVTYERKSK